MNYFTLIIGIAFTSILVVDLILTSFGFNAKDPISSRFRSGFWKIILKISGNRGTSSLLKYAGPLTITFWLLGWLLLVWAGNSIILLSDPNSVVESGTLHTTEFWPKVYFTGYTLSTLGSGEYIPYGTGWQIFSAFISFSGFMLITIAISYLLQVTSSVTDKRTLASRIYCLGSSPEGIINNLKTDDGYDNLIDHLNDFTEDVHSLAHKHIAYPILHNFHDPNPNASLEINLSRLDEALTLFYLSKECTDHSACCLQPLRNAISHFLETLHKAFIQKAENVPMPPHQGKVLQHGIAVQVNDYNQPKLEERRKLLAGWLHNQGWQWNDLFEENEAQLDIWLPKSNEKEQTK